MAKEITTIHQRLTEAQSLKRDWNIKAQRLYEIVADVDPGQHVRTEVEEITVNPLLLNCELKTGALTLNYRLARIQLQPRAEAVEIWLNQHLKPRTHRDIHTALKDRYITGLGIIAVGNDPYTGELTWYRVNPIHFYWDVPAGLNDSLWAARVFWTPQGSFYEYWDPDEHVILNDQYELVHREKNPLGTHPFVPIVAHSVPNIHFPIGDAELTYPQQVLLREVRRAILDHARRGAGMLLVEENAVPPEELRKLYEPGEPYLLVTETGKVQPLPTPPINPEWLQLEAVAKSDLDAQSGVSEYLRGSIPVANNLQFATQVLAALGAQNLRMQIDWLPVKDAIARLTEITLRWAQHNRTPVKINDISIQWDTIPLENLTILVTEDDTATLVEQVGLNQTPRR